MLRELTIYLSEPNGLRHVNRETLIRGLRLMSLRPGWTKKFSRHATGCSKRAKFGIERETRVRAATAFCIWLIPLVASISQEPVTIPSHADLAFEQKDWGLAIRNYQAVLEGDSLNGHAWLRIAQAQRALGLYVQALETLESAFAVGARGAMIEFERARNFANLGRTEDSLVALSRANEGGLRALSSLEGAEEFKAVRLRGEFQEIYSAIRRRVFPCEGIAGSEGLDFWVGDWEVRLADGSLAGRSQVTRQDGGCAVLEQWRGSGGSTGTSINYFIPSLGQWR